MSNITKIGGVNFQNLSKFSAIEMEKIAGFLHSTTEVENWVDYAHPSLWEIPSNGLGYVNGSNVWLFGNNNDAFTLNKYAAKNWGAIGTSTKAKIKFEKTKTSDSDAVMDYFFLIALDSAGEPQYYSLAEYNPTPSFTVDNDGLEITLDLDWDQGTPPLKVHSILMCALNSDSFDLKITKLQFLDANDPTSFINTNPRYLFACDTSFWTPTTNISYTTDRTGYFLMTPPNYNIDSVLTATGSWKVGFRPGWINIFVQKNDFSSGTVSVQATLYDTNGGVLGSHTIYLSTVVNSMIYLIRPAQLVFTSYDIDRLEIRVTGAGGNLKNINIRGIGFTYDV